MGAGANPEPRRSLVSKGTKGVKEDKPSSTDFPKHSRPRSSHPPRAPGILGSSLAYLGAMAALTASMVSCPTAPVAAKPFKGLSRSSLACKAVPHPLARGPSATVLVPARCSSGSPSTTSMFLRTAFQDPCQGLLGLHPYSESPKLRT